MVATGDSITLGYLFETGGRQPFRDGRLYTGDLGYVDEDGYFYLTGRDSDFIKPNGHRISVPIGDGGNPSPLGEARMV